MSVTTQLQSGRLLRLLTRHLDAASTDFTSEEGRSELLRRAWSRTGRHLRGALEDYGQEQKRQSNHPE